MKILIVTTIPATIAQFMREPLEILRARGHDMHCACGDDTWVSAAELARRTACTVHSLPLARAPSILRDTRALVSTYALIRRIRPDCIHYSTPKAALLCAIASWAARVPRRVYTMRGLLAADSPGIKGAAWRAVERLICALSHEVTINSRSNREFALRRAICPARKAVVIANGSSHGVDARGRFNPDTRAGGPESPDSPSPPRPFPRYLFAGRFAADKGIAELAGAWAIVREQIPQASLVIVGPQVESWNRVGAELLGALQSDSRVVIAGPRDNMPDWYAASDIVVLPSYREGFPNVPLEAAAMRVPVITTNALGCVDAVRHGATGLVVPVRDTLALAEAMVALGRDPQWCRELGDAGRAWVLESFDPEVIAQGLADMIGGRDGTESPARAMEKQTGGGR